MKPKWIDAKSPVFDAYFQNEFKTEVFQKNNGLYEEKPVFWHDGQKYCVEAFDHFNGHQSKFRDPSSIFRLKVRKI